MSLKVWNFDLMFKCSVGCCFQRTTKPNTHKTISCRKAFLTLTAKLYCMPILLNGALKTAPYGFFV